MMSVLQLKCCQPVKERPTTCYNTDRSTAYVKTGFRSRSLSVGRKVFHISGAQVIPDLVSSTTSVGIDNSCFQFETRDSLVGGPSLSPEYDRLQDLYRKFSVSERQADVVHVRQQYSWDCGVACVLMVLPDTARKCLILNLAEICHQEGFNKSTWTIDLAYLLHRFGVQFRYYTVTIGVDVGLASEKFYEEVIYKDELRVIERFKQAEAHGIFIEQKSVPLDAIIDHLLAGQVVIVLTNANLLRCQHCSKNILRDCLKSPCQQRERYQGHFVVLVGVETMARRIFYADPSTRQPRCCCSFDHFQEARLSYGTDEDIIFIDKR